MRFIQNNHKMLFLYFFKRVIKQFTPPIFFLKFRKEILPIQESQYGWFGHYVTWEDAAKLCTGYDTNNIIEKVKESSLKVKNGDAVFERDSVLFYDKQYSWPLLAILLRISSEQNGRLHILDFGGSLGSTYTQNKDFLSVVNNFNWSIVEQPHYVSIGKKLFEDQFLKFYDTVSECLTERNCNVFLISSVLQYLEFPIILLDQILNYNFEYIILDRTSFVTSEIDLLTIQHVSPDIFTASLPCWFFNEVNKD